MAVRKLEESETLKEVGIRRIGHPKKGLVKIDYSIFFKLKN